MAAACACHPPIPTDTAELQTYLREHLGLPGVAVISEGREGIYIFIPRAGA